MGEVVHVAFDEPESDPFADFWTLYPRHIAKKDAQKAWARIDAAQHMLILSAVLAWRRVWLKNDSTFIPYPATWLNGERWEDELPKGTTVSSSSHLPAVLPILGERAPMPDNVRAALAKLRGKA